MTGNPRIDDDLRETIISLPDVILEDQDLMRALIAANERSMGGNIVDLRGIAMDRLEARLDRLEDTHRSVIAAAGKPRALACLAIFLGSIAPSSIE